MTASTETTGAGQAGAPPAMIPAQAGIAAALAPTLGERAEAYVAALPGRITATRFFAPSAVAGVTFLANLVIVYSVWSRLHYGAFDLTIFDQAVRNYSQFHLPHVPVKGAYAGTGVGFLQLGDHFSPINALAAPLYWIWSDVRMLLLLQCALYASAAAVIWLYTRDVLGSRAATVVGLAFGLGWGVQQATAVGYHELDWAVLIIPLALRRLQLGKARQALLVACALFLVKEELGFVVAMFGVILWLRGHRRLGYVAAGLGTVWSGLAISAIVPSISGSTTNQYWTYNSLGPNPKAAAIHVLTHPLSTAHMLVANPDKQNLLIWLLAITVGACFLSPLSLLVIPPLALRMLSDTPTYSMTKFHYNAPLMGILLLAGVEGCAKIMSRLDRVELSAGLPEGVPTPAVFAKRLWLAAVATVTVLGVQIYAYGDVRRPVDPSVTSYAAAAQHAAAMIPHGATVESESAIAVLISARTQNLILAEPGKPHGSEWVVLGKAQPVANWPWANNLQVEKARRWYLAHGYESVWSDNGVFVMRLVGPVPPGINDVWVKGAK